MYARRMADDPAVVVAVLLLADDRSALCKGLQRGCCEATPPLALPRSIANDDTAAFRRIAGCAADTPPIETNRPPYQRPGCSNLPYAITEWSQINLLQCVGYRPPANALTHKAAVPDEKKAGVG